MIDEENYNIKTSPHNIVWRYIVMQLSYHFQNIVEISISLKFWKYHTILVKGYALWNSHFRSTLKAIHSVSCLQCASKIKITWLFAFVKTYLQHELAYFCHFKAFDAFNVYHYVYYSRVSHYFLTNFAPILRHEISLISCDYRINSQNIV